MEKFKDAAKMIFVFGSNLSGIHGAGAARYAYLNRGAQLGVGEGPTGTCYAIPTKGKNIGFIGLYQINQHVQKFLSYAEENKDLEFQVTQVGCGLGGFIPQDIAHMFKDAPSNCFFDTNWKSLLPESTKFWGTFP